MIKLVEGIDIILCELKIKEIEVFLEVVELVGFGEGNGVLFKIPAKQDLSGSFLIAGGDLVENRFF